MEWSGGAISELPAALYPHRKSWLVLILIPPMPLVSEQNEARRAARQAEENSEFKSCDFLIKTLPSDGAKTRGKRKEGPRPGRLFQQAYNCG